MVEQISNNSPPRKLPKQSRSVITVNAILDATAHIFVTKGYAKTNTNIIAEHAGVSIGSLYQYFQNKEALINALHRRHVERMQKIVLKIIRDPIDFNDRSSLFSLIQAIVKAHLLEPELHLKFEEIKTLECCVSSYEPDLGGIQQQVLNRISILPQISKHQRKLCAFTLMHTIHALVHVIAFKRPANLPIKAMIEETVKVVERYLEI